MAAHLFEGDTQQKLVAFVEELASKDLKTLEDEAVWLGKDAVYFLFLCLQLGLHQPVEHAYRSQVWNKYVSITFVYYFSPDSFDTLADKYDTDGPKLSQGVARTKTKLWELLMEYFPEAKKQFLIRGYRSVNQLSFATTHKKTVRFNTEKSS